MNNFESDPPLEGSSKMKEVETSSRSEPRQLIDFVRFALTALFIPPSVILGGTAINVARIFAKTPKDKEFASRIASLWSRILFRILRVRIKVVGLKNLENVKIKKGSIIVANHGGTYDPFILAAALGQAGQEQIKMAFLAKKILEKIFFLGGS